MTSHHKPSINHAERDAHPACVSNLTDDYSLKTQIIKKRRETLLFPMDSLNFA
jgi:hypothetical protein